MAIQSTDKEHAVRAIRELRELHARYAPTVNPDPVAQDLAPDRTQDDRTQDDRA
jgi:hypothetical protein